MHQLYLYPKYGVCEPQPRVLRTLFESALPAMQRSGAFQTSFWSRLGVHVCQYPVPPDRVLHMLVFLYWRQERVCSSAQAVGHGSVRSMPELFAPPPTYRLGRALGCADYGPKLLHVRQPRWFVFASLHGSIATHSLRNGRP